MNLSFQLFDLTIINRILFHTINVHSTNFILYVFPYIERATFYYLRNIDNIQSLIIYLEECGLPPIRRLTLIFRQLSLGEYLTFDQIGDRNLCHFCFSGRRNNYNIGNRKVCIDCRPMMNRESKINNCHICCKETYYRKTDCCNKYFCLEHVDQYLTIDHGKYKKYNDHILTCKIHSNEEFIKEHILCSFCQSQNKINQAHFISSCCSKYICNECSSYNIKNNQILCPYHNLPTKIVNCFMCGIKLKDIRSSISPDIDKNVVCFNCQSLLEIERDMVIQLPNICENCNIAAAVVNSSFCIQCQRIFDASEDIEKLQLKLYENDIKQLRTESQNNNTGNIMHDMIYTIPKNITISIEDQMRYQGHYK